MEIGSTGHLRDRGYGKNFLSQMWTDEAKSRLAGLAGHEDWTAHDKLVAGEHRVPQRHG